MSAGNLKNDRSKGNNFRYQFDTLRLLGSVAAATAGGATEATLAQLLAAVQSGTEFEARLVEDALNVTWLEVRTWNTSTGGWNPPLYYPPGSNTPGIPTAPVVYINNSSVLALIESNTATNATEATLALVQAVLSLGQAANADSLAVTLSSEQEAILTAMGVDLAAIEVIQTGIASDIALVE